MKPEIIELSSTIEKDLERFYEAGELIRHGRGIGWLSTKEERIIKIFFTKNTFRHKVLLAKSESSMARLIAFIDEKNNGAIGWYECSPDESIHTKIIAAAFDWLKSEDCKLVVGPMNGNTWNNYRFNLSCDYPLFPGEPYQPDYYVTFWKNSGFEEYINYVTEVPPRDIVQPMTRDELDFLLHSNQLSALNLTVETGRNYFEKLHAFYHVCFANNPLFHPISLEEYNLISQKSEAILNADHSFLILDEYANVAGIFISFNDYFYHLCQDKPDTPEIHKRKKLVIKTLAVSPQYRNKQLGTLMINFIHHTAYQNGYEQVIHALMYDGNISAVKGKEKFKTEVIRRYSLFKKEL